MSEGGTKTVTRILTWKELAAAINNDPGALCRYSSREGFPQDRNPEKVQAWLIKNIRPRMKRRHAGDPQNHPSSLQNTATLASAQASIPFDNPTPTKPGRNYKPIESMFESLASEDDPFIKDLMSGKASAITISRAAMQMASRRVGRAAVQGTLSANDLDGLKKTLQELRAAEEDYIALDVSSGKLMPRDEVEGLFASIVGNMVNCLSVIENSIGTEFSIWLTTAEVAAMSQEDRTRKVRDWVANLFRTVRQAEADGVTAMLAKMKDDEENG